MMDSILYDEGLNAYNERDFKHAIECFEKLISINEKDYELWVILGHAYLFSEEFDYAEKCFDYILDNFNEANLKNISLALSGQALICMGSKNYVLATYNCLEAIFFWNDNLEAKKLLNSLDDMVKQIELLFANPFIIDYKTNLKEILHNDEKIDDDFKELVLNNEDVYDSLIDFIETYEHNCGFDFIDEEINLYNTFNIGIFGSNNLELIDDECDNSFIDFMNMLFDDDEEYDNSLADFINMLFNDDDLDAELREFIISCDELDDELKKEIINDEENFNELKALIINSIDISDFSNSFDFNVDINEFEEFCDSNENKSKDKYKISTLDDFM